jgi:tripartite ATP-independent transporter DctP family solute receptor
MAKKSSPRITAAALVVVTLLIAALTLVVRQQTSDKIVLKLAHGLDIEHPVHLGMVYMAERFAEKTDGAATVEIFPSEQLGSEREYLEQVQLGSIDMAKSSAAALEQFVPEMAVFGVPYIFRDSDHYWQTIEGEVGKGILAAGESVGFRGLCYYDAGARSFYVKEKPINTPDDLLDMKIRVQQSKTAMEMVEALGGAPTPIPWGELYTALQQGVVDGAENNPPSFYTSRHWEVAKYYTLDEHALVPDVLLMSRTVWEELPQFAQRALTEAVAESVEYQKDLWAKMTAEALEKVQAEGVEVIRPDKSAFADRVVEMHRGYEGTLVGGLINEIQAVN